MKHHPALRLWIFAFTLALMLTPHAARAHGEVLWPYLSVPPLFILGPDGLGGFGPELQKALQDALPEHTHRTEHMSLKRIVQDAKRGAPVVLVGVVKTPQREKTLIFSSLPCRMASPPCAVMLAKDMPRLAPDGEFPLAERLADPAIRWGYGEGYVFGAAQPLLDAHKEAPNATVVAGDSSLRILIKMLDTGRLDWFPFGFMGPERHALPLDDPGKLAFVALSKMDRPVLGYVACPRTDWGRSVIKRLDPVLYELIRSGRLYDLMQPWVPLNMHGRFTADYKDLVLEPALAAAAAGR